MGLNYDALHQEIFAKTMFDIELFSNDFLESKNSKKFDL